jgi:hypothetical protein
MANGAGRSLSVGFGLFAVASSACNGSAPARAASDAAADAIGDAGGPEGGAIADATAESAVAPPPPHYGLCPDAMGPTFPSIVTQMFATASCGASMAFECHSSTGALPRVEGGTGSLLDFSLDAEAIYAELLGDGSGQPGVNIQGDAGGVILRVAPGQPDASLLFLKLAMPTEFDPRYGQAMPPNVLPCPAAIDAVEAWIVDGAAPH